MAKRDPKANPGKDEQLPENSGGHSGGSGAPKISSSLSSALRISTGYPLGINRADKHLFEYKYNSNANTFEVNTYTKPTPGLCVVHYVPTWGAANGQLSTGGINRAQADLFDALRAAISGNRPYESGDLMVDLMAVDSLRDLYEYVSRIYKIIHNYSPTNLYTPKAILEGMGLDYEDWYANAPKLYQWLLLNKRSLAYLPSIPIGTISARRKEYNSVLYKDCDSDYAQIYVMNQRYFFSYEVVDQVKGLTLRTFPATFSEFESLWDTMYNAVRTSSDVFIISADIKRAFADKYVVDLTPPGELDEVEFKYDSDVLTSIANATLLGLVDVYEHYSQLNRDYEAAMQSGLRYEVVDNGMLQVPALWNANVSRTSTNLAGVGLPAYNSHLNLASTGNPSDSEVLAACRLHAVAKVQVGTLDDPSVSSNRLDAVTVQLESFGTEVVTHVTYINNPEATDGYGISNLSCYNEVAMGVAGETMEAARFYAQISPILSYDYRPVQYFDGSLFRTDADLDAVFCTEDVQMYVPVEDESISNIFRNYILSEFNVD